MTKEDDMLFIAVFYASPCQRLARRMMNYFWVVENDMKVPRRWKHMQWLLDPLILFIDEQGQKKNHRWALNYRFRRELPHRRHKVKLDEGKM